MSEKKTSELELTIGSLQQLEPSQKKVAVQIKINPDLKNKLQLFQNYKGSMTKDQIIDLGSAIMNFEESYRDENGNKKERKIGENYLVKFNEKHPGLNTDEIIKVVEIVTDYKTNFAVTTNLLNNDFSVENVEKAIMLKQNRTNIGARRNSEFDLYKTDPHDYSNSLSYNNLVFMSELLNTKDIDVIEQHVEIVEERLNDYHADLGISTAIHMLEEEYERREVAMTFECLLMKTFNIVPNEYINFDDC